MVTSPSKLLPRLAKNHIRIYPALPAPVPNVLKVFQESQMRQLDPKNARRQLFRRSSPNSVRAGAVLQIDCLSYPTKTQSSFIGVLMSIKRRGLESTFRLRNKLANTGVEMVFPLYSPMVRRITVLQHCWRKRVRRAKLFYLRTPKHDIKSSIQAGQKPIRSIA